ncbi:hypothetical protein, partial [Nodosilinea sp. E11]|uniref:hypothetical protein n=1 Tax=Nodosilinea sp. E11 TaxID=3037479 RepID=UPI0029341A86
PAHYPRTQRSHWLTHHDRTLSSSRTLPMALHNVAGAMTQAIAPIAAHYDDDGCDRSKAQQSDRTNSP